MKIEEFEGKFRQTLAVREETTHILVHHTAGNSNSNAMRIHATHLNNGWWGIGYHFIIMANGTIERGRPFHAEGSHEPSLNKVSVGIVLTGNFEKYKPFIAQKQSLSWLISAIKVAYPHCKVGGHKDFRATLCPGKNLDLNKILMGKPVTTRDTDSVLKIAVDGIEIEIPGVKVVK